MEPDANTLSIAAFTALGTIVGYLGAEAAPPSMFDRLLWPTRFYNTTRLRSFVGMALLMPVGGPIHKAALESMNKLVFAGLWKGYCRGEMLGTPFYKDTGHFYVVRNTDDSQKGRREARNAFWITVLELIAWRPPMGNTAARATPIDDEAAEKLVNQTRAQRPVLVLKLSRGDSVVTGGDVSVVDGNIGDLKFRYFAGIVASEAVTLIIGAVTAGVWKSLFSIWYLAPLLVKVAVLFSRVRRTMVESALSEREKADTPANEEQILCEVVDFSKGFFLINGPSDLVLQFFRHYGHPIRNRSGLLGDRAREVISMFAVVALVTVYPAAMLAFIFAPVPVQWIWLGYQLYAVLAMHMYQFRGGGNFNIVNTGFFHDLEENDSDFCPSLEEADDIDGSDGQDSESSDPETASPKRYSPGIQEERMDKLFKGDRQAEAIPNSVPFPGNTAGVNSLFSLVSATNLTPFMIYASLHPDTCGNGQLFNVTDNEVPCTYGELWPRLTSWFGLVGTGPVEDSQAEVGSLAVGEPPQDDRTLALGEYIARGKDVLAQHGHEKTMNGGVSAGSRQLDSVRYWLTFDRHLSLEKLRRTGFKADRDSLEGWIQSFEMFKKAWLIL
ncbi:hypothetical protein NUW58_g3184 [Xylaria curta]|uniref:Uncharacterized protein n=1 Tax=Xylaria curta TaxID=42375 RepID=A0ACC1PDN5_9PEZI|nr:hypothetical protein NUW58_g3184 [Xylaria curta]